jgi:hypothetical protein
MLCYPLSVLLDLRRCYAVVQYQPGISIMHCQGSDVNLSQPNVRGSQRPCNTRHVA